MDTEKQLQSSLLNLVGKKLKKNQNITTILMDVLDLNKDAVYRRVRLETDLTLNELQKISAYFEISIDAVMNEKENVAFFDFYPLSENGFSIDNYLNFIHRQVTFIAKLERPEIILTVNNTPFFSLFDFPDLLRFKLFFWAKNQINQENYQTMKLEDFEFDKKQLQLIFDIASVYASIPTIELYDPITFQGLVREIDFYHTSNEMTSQTAIQLLDNFQSMIDHMNAQAESGRKSVFGKQEKKATIEIYYNEILNATALFYYSAKTSEGLYIAHNFLSPITISNEKYILETKQVLQNIINHSSKISKTGAKLRNQFFSEALQYLAHYKSKIVLNAEMKNNFNTK